MQEIAIQCLERGAHAFMIWMQKDYQGKLVKINQIYEMPFNQWYHRVFRQRQNEAPTAAPSPQLKPADPSPADPAASEDAVQAPLKPLAEITSEILRYASCKSSSDVQQKLRHLETLAAKYGEEGIRQAALAREAGERVREWGNRFDLNLKKTKGKKPEDCQKEKEEMLQEFRNAHPEYAFAVPELKKTFNKKINFYKNIPQYNNYTCHYRENHIEHRIFKLNPANQWYCYLDETGDQFEGASPPSGKKTENPGRLIAFLISEEERRQLKPLKKEWHSNKESPEEIEHAFQQLMDRPSGVLGISFREMNLQGHRHAAMITELVSLVLRFLPLPAETADPVRLNVIIENRANIPDEPVHWEPVRAELLRQLHEADPERAKRIHLEFQVVPKGIDLHLAYADVLAYLWGSQRQEIRKMRKISDLNRFGLTEDSVWTLREAWDLLGSGRRVPPDLWQKLVSDPQWQEKDSPAEVLFARLQECCRRDPELWNAYAAETRRHLESKAVGLPMLRRELAWLRECHPREELPPRLELAYLVSNLALLNHVGEAFFAETRRILELTDKLYLEDAPLCCYTHLHLAVSCTNRFAFREAREIVRPWGRMTPEIPGIQMWARVQSTLGQLEAFEGRPHAALDYFDLAMDAFGHLTDEKTARGELLHTGTYRAIARMDDPHSDPESVQEAVAFVTGDLPEAVKRLAMSDRDAEKYAHHLLLRFLVLHPAGEPWQKPYLAHAGHWQMGQGHPWPLIAFYRALLLRDAQPDAAAEWLHEALTSAGDGGPILQWMARVMARIGEMLDIPVADPVLSESELTSAIPALIPRVSSPEFWLPDSWKSFLNYALPFNFH